MSGAITILGPPQIRYPEYGYPKVERQPAAYYVDPRAEIPAPREPSVVEQAQERKREEDLRLGRRDADDRRQQSFEDDGKSSNPAIAAYRATMRAGWESRGTLYDLAA